jgi:catechol 2,3-dioxygenase-like lactoylglutathione lyase family enzyme
MTRPTRHAVSALAQQFVACVLFFVAVLSSSVASPPPQGAREIAHLALRMSDPERTLAFYRDFLGFPERFRTNKVPGAPNVYYRHGVTPADLEKEKQGTLLLVDLRIGTGQSLELFAGKADGDSVLHHVAVAVEDLDATRNALESLGVGVPPPALPDGKPLGNFFARDPNGQDIEVCRPREPAQVSTSGSEGLDGRVVQAVFFASDEEGSRRFYAGALGFDARPVPGGLLATTTQGDRIELLTSDGMMPALVIKVDNVERVRQWLEERPARAAYPESLEIQPGARRALVLRDPDGMSIRIEESGEARP